jgi:hypothetical protein
LPVPGALHVGLHAARAAAHMMHPASDVKPGEADVGAWRTVACGIVAGVCHLAPPPCRALSHR